MRENDVFGKRVKLENPQELFYAVKKSSEYFSWKNLVESIGCGNTTLKSYRAGKRAFKGEVFEKLLKYLDKASRKNFLQKAVLLEEN